MKALYTCLALLLISQVTFAQKLEVDNVHVRNWNMFVDNLVKLHQNLIAQDNVTQKTKVDGYANLPEFYIETSYYLGEKLVSRLQWEREKPDNLHAIDVFIHDDKGRVIRDYSATYLPHYRNAPSQTLVSFHNYNDSLRAFRTFDASGDRLVERCMGTVNGKEFQLLLDEDEIYEARSGDSNIMESDMYKRCFDGLTDELGKYRSPQ